MVRSDKNTHGVETLTLMWEGHCSTLEPTEKKDDIIKRTPIVKTVSVLRTQQKGRKVRVRRLERGSEKERESIDGVGGVGIGQLLRDHWRQKGSYVSLEKQFQMDGTH